MSLLVYPLLMPNSFFLGLPLTSSNFLLKFKFNKFICPFIKMANKNFSEKHVLHHTLGKLISQDQKM